MTYEYEEGQVPVPARRCPRDLTELATADDASGVRGGWFQPSRYDKGTWVYSSKDRPEEGNPTLLRCPTCERVFALYS